MKKYNLICLVVVVLVLFNPCYSQIGTLIKLKNKIAPGKEEDNTVNKKEKDQNIVMEELPERLLNSNYQFDDPELSHEKIEEILYKTWENCDTLYTIRVQKFAPGQEYLYYKTDYGTPWYKDTWPAAFAVYRGKDSACYYVEDIQFQRVYDAGEYGKPFITFQRKHTKIKCEKARAVKEEE